jgi:small subunit ribosomal protein S6
MTVFTPSTEDVRLYEVMVLLPLDLSEEEFQLTLQNVEELVEERGGKQLHRDIWSRRGLAYPIRKHREGRYVVYIYELSPGNIREVDAALRIERGVLRHLIVKPPKHYDVVNYEERFQAWQRERVEQARAAERAREEEIKRQIVKRAAAPIPEPARVLEGKEKEKEGVKGVELQKPELEQELQKLISDEDLHL